MSVWAGLAAGAEFFDFGRALGHFGAQFADRLVQLGALTLHRRQPFFCQRIGALQLGDIAAALKQVFGYSAKEVAKFFKNAWNVVDELVADALNLAGYAAHKVEDAMCDVYHWAQKKWDEFTDVINPSNW